MQDEEPVQLPVYIGLTRPPTTFGVPVIWFGILFTILGMGLVGLPSIRFKLFWAIFIVGGGYLLGRLLTEKDPFWMHILRIKAAKTPPIRNRLIWKSNSYRP